MRDIKFRAWDKDEKCWITSKQLAITADGELITYDEVASDYVQAECFVKDPIDVIFMQYTGLKDKNGVEIYEGDIMRVGQNIVCSIQYFNSPNEDDTAIGFFGWSHFKFGATAIDKWFLENGKVIGNIYENPELLENK